MKKTSFYGILLSLILLPSVAFAAPSSFRDILQLLIVLLGNFMKVLYAAAFAAFFWGVFLFILNTSDDKKRGEAKAWMFWAVIAIFAMLSVWGLVGLLVNTFGLSGNAIPQL